MGWILDKNRPICPQIYEQICTKIASGEYGPDEKLLSVREIAVEAGVNPNTVQKSFEQLSKDGIIYSVSGSGNYVSHNTELAKTALGKLVDEKIAAYFEEMRALGFDDVTIKKYVEEWNK